MSLYDHGKQMISCWDGKLFLDKPFSGSFPVLSVHSFAAFHESAEEDECPYFRDKVASLPTELSRPAQGFVQ